jgi:hypothetical protein
MAATAGTRAIPDGGCLTPGVGASYPHPPRPTPRWPDVRGARLCDDRPIETEPTSHGTAYRLDQLGWLQFERLCPLVLEAEAGLAELAWSGHADTGLAVV